jgi:hypothetical protein
LNKSTFILSTIFILSLTSCGISGGPSLLGSGATASSVTLSNPGKLYQGGQYTFTGSCAPNGSFVKINLSSATPAQITNCPCSAGSFSCAGTTLTSIPTPTFTVQAQNDNGDTSAVTVASAVPNVSLNDPGFFDSGDTITFSGTCSPDELDVDLTLTNASPASINCPCSSSNFSCPATTLTSLSTPSLAVKASNFQNSSSSQIVFTSRTAYATAATIPVSFGLNMTMDLTLTGPSSLPGNQVTISSSCYDLTLCNYGSFNLAGNAVGNFSLQGFTFLTSTVFPTDNSPEYLDIKGGAGSLDRVLNINFGVSPQSLDTTGSKYYFWLGVVGLGPSPESATFTSNRTLQVIGYQDSASNGEYSYLDGAPTTLGSTGTSISTKPASGSNGYTFYYIQDRTASTLQLTLAQGATPEYFGFILGVIEVRN